MLLPDWSKQPRLRLYLWSAVFTLMYVSLPWDLFEKNLRDARVYLWHMEYLAKSDVLEVSKERSGILFWVMDELLWRHLLFFLTRIFDNYRIALTCISGTALYLYAIFIFGRVRYPLAAFFLFNPLFIDVVNSQMRSALAFSLLMVGFFGRNQLVRVSCAITAPLIHTSSAAFLLLFVIFRGIDARWPQLSIKFFCICACTVGLLVSLCMALALGEILAQLGDRRAAMQAEASSVLYASFWMVLAILQCLLRFRATQEQKFIGFLSCTMMAIFFFNSVFDISGLRFVALTLPVIVASISAFPRIYRYYTFIALAGYQVVQSTYWIGEAGL